MAAIMNGMAAHGGVLPVGGTFFVFSDYMRPAVRLAALSQEHVIYSWTHDSIGLGEDGPTHQPVEQLASLRAMPGLILVRPADANETAQAWRLAVESDEPVGLALTRQDVPVLEGTAERADAGVAKGGYVLAEAAGAAGAPQVVLIGTGSEVQLCLGAAKVLGDAGVAARVVSLPCWEWFEEQRRRRIERRSSPAACPPSAWRRARPSAGAATPTTPSGWTRSGLRRPGPWQWKKFGFTVEHVVERAQALLAAVADRAADAHTKELLT